MSAMNKWLRKCRLPLECLSYVAVIGGIGLFFLQQQSVHRAQRVETAMLFVQLENEPAFAEARAALEAPWRQVDMSQLRPTEGGRAQLQLTVTRQVADERIEKVADFYSSVLACRASETCEAEVTDQFFRTSIEGFYCAYDVRLARIAQRLNRPDYADALRAYSVGCD
jgi:hypothetical protein